MFVLSVGFLVLSYFQTEVYALDPCMRIDYAKVTMEFPQDTKNFPALCDVVLIARSWLLTERFCMKEFDRLHGNPKFQIKIDLNGETTDLKLSGNSTKRYLSKSASPHDLSQFSIRVAQDFVMSADNLQGGGKTCTDVIPNFEAIKTFFGKYVCTRKEHAAKTMFIDFVKKYIPSVKNETICNVNWLKGAHPSEWVDAPKGQSQANTTVLPVQTTKKTTPKKTTPKKTTTKKTTTKKTTTK